MQKKKYYINIIFMLFLLGAVFFVLLKDQDLYEIMSALKKADKTYMFLASVAAVVFIVLQGVSIKIILKSLGEKLSLLKSVTYTFVEFLFNAITPSASGGQPMQVIYMNSDGVNMGASSVALLFWTIIYKIALIVIELAVFLISPGFARHYLGKYMWLFIVGIAVNVVSIFLYSIIVFSKNGAKNIAYFCTWLLHKLRIVKKKEKIEKKLDHLLASYQEGAEYMRSHIGTAVVVLGITIVQRLAYFVITWFVYKSLGFSEYTCFQITALQSFGAVCIDILPFPGGVGVNEGFFVKLFAPVMGRSKAVSAMLLSRGASFYVLLILSAVVSLGAQAHKIHKEGKKIRIGKHHAAENIEQNKEEV